MSFPVWRRSSFHFDGTVKPLASRSKLWRTQQQKGNALTWHRTACAQHTGPYLMSAHVRKTDGLLTDSLSKWDSRLYVNWAMFRGFGCSLAVAWRASILRKMRMRAKGKERRFQNAVNTVIRSLFLLAVSLFGQIIIIIIVVIIDSKTKRLF